MNSSALGPGMLAAGGGSNRMGNQWQQYQQQHQQQHQPPFQGPPHPPHGQSYGPPQHHQGWGPGPGPRPMHHGQGYGGPAPTLLVRPLGGFGYGFRAPPGSVIVAPGDPRLGG